LLSEHLLTVAPGVVGACTDTHSHQDDLFLLGSSDWYLAEALGNMATEDNIYVVSARDDPRGDSIYHALDAHFSSKEVRRLRFAAGGPVSVVGIRAKITEDLAIFVGDVTVIFVVSDVELISLFPLLREQSRFTQFLTANVDTAAFQQPALAAIKDQLVAVNFAGATDYLPTHVSFYQLLQFAFSLSNPPLPLNALTARVFDSFVALETAWKNPLFQQGRHEDVPSFRNFQFAKSLADTLSTSGWLGVDKYGNRQDHIFQARRLLADGSWGSIGQPIVIED